MAGFKPLDTFLQGSLPAMGQAASKFAGYQDRPVSLGQMLGAMGGAGMQGQMQAQQYNQQGRMQDLNMQNIQQQMLAAKQAEARAAQQHKALGGMAPAQYTAMMNAGKFGAPKKIADPSSSTGYSWQEVNQAGNKRITGEAPKPIPMMGNVESEENKARGKALVAREQSVIDRAQTGRDTMAYTAMARQMISDPNIDPTSFGTMVGTMASKLGVPMSESMTASVTTGQAFEGVMGNILAAKLASQKGPQTDKDADRMAKTLAQLQNTKEAKTFLLGAADAMAMRDIEKEAFYEEWMETHNGSSKGAKAAWNKDVGKMPLFGSNPKTNMPIFYNEFMQTMRQANPSATDAKIKALWVTKYGR